MTLSNLSQKLEKVIPRRVILPLIFCLCFNNLIYFIPRMFLQNVHHYDFTSQLDRSVPFIPAWIYIYVICYLFWVVNYILIGRGTKEELYRFVTAELLAKLICGLFYIFLPTTNIRPQVPGTDFASALTRLIYQLDEPTNLFPSIHCMVSWFCFVGVRKRPDIPFWYKIFSAVFAVLVFLSTQFTKQHYFVDMVGGVLLAEVCFAFCQHTNIYHYMEMFWEKINRKVWRNYETEH